MKNVSAFIVLTAALGKLLFFSCKKEYSCEDCIGNNHRPVAVAGADTLAESIYTLLASNAVFYDKIFNLYEQLKGQSMNNQSMNKQRKFLITFFVLTFLGFMPLLNVISGPAFENNRGVYVMRLIGTGMCWGVAIVFLVSYFRGRRST